jgi:uncharacterized protein
LFSFLFGFSMALQMARIEERGGRFVRFWVRRLCVLFGIGVCHVLFLWNGDILINYALLGFVLLAFRRRAPSRLIAWAIPCLLVPIVVTVGIIGYVQRTGTLEGNAPPPSTTAPTTAPATAPNTAPTEAPTTPSTSRGAPESMFDAWVEADYEVYAHGTYGEIFVQRLYGYPVILQITVLYLYGGILGMFLLGLYAGRRRILHDSSAHAPLIRKIAGWGLAVGVVGNLASVVGNELVRPMDYSWLGVVPAVGMTLGEPALCLFYVSGIVLLTQREAWRRRLRPLAAVGRTALSNYLLQSLICTLIFNGYGLGLYGRVSPAVGFGLTCVIFALQIPLSGWWLRRFRFGPVEWVWRSLTYGKRQPMVRRPDAAE